MTGRSGRQLGARLSCSILYAAVYPRLMLDWLSWFASYTLLGVLIGVVLALFVTLDRKKPEFPLEAYAYVALIVFVVSWLMASNLGYVSTGGRDPEMIKVADVPDGERWRHFSFVLNYLIPILIGVGIVHKIRDKSEEKSKRQSENREEERRAASLFVHMRFAISCYANIRVPKENGLEQLDGLDASTLFERAYSSDFRFPSPFDMTPDQLQTVRISNGLEDAERREITYSVDHETGKLIREDERVHS